MKLMEQSQPDEYTKSQALDPEQHQNLHSEFLLNISCQINMNLNIFHF